MSTGEDPKPEAPVFECAGHKYKSAEEVSAVLHSILHLKYALGSYLTGPDRELLLALLSHHPSAAEKIGCGVAEIAVTRHKAFHNLCFLVVRKDGTTEDFSALKCLDMLFPNPEASQRHADRVKVPKSVLRCDVTIKVPEEAHENEAPVVIAAINALEKVFAAKFCALDVEPDGKPRCQLALYENEEDAKKAVNRLENSVADAQKKVLEAVEEALDKKEGCEVILSGIAVAEKQEEKLLWEKKAYEEERSTRLSARRKREGTWHENHGQPNKKASRKDESDKSESNAPQKDVNVPTPVSVPQDVKALIEPTKNQFVQNGTVRIGRVGKPPGVASKRKPINK